MIQNSIIVQPENSGTVFVTGGSNGIKGNIVYLISHGTYISTESGTNYQVPIGSTIMVNPGGGSPYGDTLGGTRDVGTIGEYFLHIVEGDFYINFD